MRYILSFTLAITALFGVAQQTQKLSLSMDEAIALAKANNVALKNAQLDIDFANSQVNEIKSQGLPQVSGSASFAHTYQIPTQLIPGDFVGQPGTFIPVQFGVPFNVNAGIGVRQLLFDGTFFLGLKAASEFVNISRLSASSSEIEVKESVIKAYYMALISDENLIQLEASWKNIQKVKEETQAMYNEGFAEKLDVDRITLSAANLELSISQLQNQAKLARQLLLNSVGVDLNQELVLTSALPNENSIDLITETFDPNNRIEMKLLNQQQALNELDLKRYKVGYLPSLYGNFSYGTSTFASKGQFGDLGNDWYANGTYSLGLSLPIFDGFYKKAKVDQAKIQINKTENTKKQATLGMNLQVSQAKTNYANALKGLEIQKKSQALAESIFSTTSIKFKEGLGSSFEMINAENELTQAKTNYLNALYNLNVAKIDFDKALGNL
jgi:outer membrane protein